MDILTKILITVAVFVPVFFLVGLFEAVVVGPFRGPEETFGGKSAAALGVIAVAIGVLKILALVWLA
jgi:hypothetical protein